MEYSSPSTTILRALIRFFVLALAMLWAPLALLLDTVILNDEVSEFSATELSQEFLLLCSCVIFWRLSVRRPSGRGFYTLVAGFFSCMFIREQDALFDLISHGFWVYPATLTALTTLLLAASQRRSILPAMAAATRSMTFNYILTGLAILLFFSRVMGTGSLWALVLPEVDEALIKNSIQESLELLGYILIFYGTLLYRYSSKVEFS
ncbi:hypothetical protein [Marinobacterium rhizophilum]|uniref:hypothetical protein n=1 Tax=Marinobacterium rhizophilum TaxID=420402 RepID=UPI000364A578|nr:hypothetical protein [Marinobacterium rhizophilum]